AHHADPGLRATPTPGLRCAPSGAIFFKTVAPGGGGSSATTGTRGRQGTWAFGAVALRLCRRPNAAERMLDDRLPCQLLQQSVELLLLIAELRLLENVGHRQPDRAAAVDRGVIAVGDQGLQRRSAVAERVGEQVLLHFQPGRLPRDDLLPQRDHGLR